MNLLRASVLALLILIPTSGSLAQVDMSAELSNFLDFVDANYLANISNDEREELDPYEVAWILGKAFEVEYEWVGYHTVENTRNWRLRYLDLLWEELIDYITIVVEQYFPSYDPLGVRTVALHGFYSYDQYNQLGELYRRLQLSSPIPGEQLIYTSSMPAGGRGNYREGYRKPWTMPMEELFNATVNQGSYLETPGESYAKSWSEDAGGFSGLTSDVISGRSTGRDGDDSPYDRDDVGEDYLDESYSVDKGPLFGKWRFEGSRGYIEFTFNVSGKSGTFTRKTVVNGTVTKSMSGQLEGYRQQNGEYYQYKVYAGDEEGYLELFEMTSTRLRIKFLGSRYTLVSVN